MAYQIIAYLTEEQVKIIMYFCLCQLNIHVLSCSTEVKRQWKQTIAGKSPNFPNACLKIMKSFENMQ